MRRLHAKRRGEYVAPLAPPYRAPPLATKANVDAILAAIPAMEASEARPAPVARPRKVKPKKEIVYVIVHPMWPRYVKIGHSSNPSARLVTYNTGDPFRRYAFAYKQNVTDRIVAERDIHALLASYRFEKTEWFHIHTDDAIAVIKRYHSCNNVASG
jgi:hypothetical protein